MCIFIIRQCLFLMYTRIVRCLNECMKPKSIVLIVLGPGVSKKYLKTHSRNKTTLKTLIIMPIQPLYVCNHYHLCKLRVRQPLGQK